MSIWKTKSVIEKKPWGQTVNIPSNFGYKGKIISIKADHRTSLKYYSHLKQVLYCMSGRLLVFAPDEKEFGDFSDEEGNYFELSPGDVINIEPRNPYRIKAYEDSVLVEVLLGHVRTGYKMIDDDYGRINNLDGD